MAFNFPDMHDFIKTMDKYREFIAKEKEEEKPKNPLKRYFNFNDKVSMMTPFAYSIDKEKMSGFNDEIHF